MIEIDWNTHTIFVPKIYMTVLQVSPFEILELEINQFRLDLKNLEATIPGVVEPKTHLHNTEYVLSGVSYARSVEILPPYNIEFEDGQYGVSLVGANSNILDVKIPNQVSLLANNSGGLINSEAINDQSYLGGKIFINTQGLGEPGTTYPKGTPTHPSDNWNDAHTIATLRRLFGYNLKGVLLFAAGNLTDIERSDFISSSPIEGIIIFDGRSTLGCSFQLCGITGLLNGRASYKECALGSILNFSGIATDCGFNGNVQLDEFATDAILFRDCISVVSGTSRPTLDCNNTSANINIRGYVGGLNIANFTSGNNLSIDVDSGTVEIESNCTSGTIVVRGMCKLIDNSGPGCTVVIEGTVTELVNAGSSVWTTLEKDTLIAKTDIIKDQSEISAIHAVDKLNE